MSVKQDVLSNAIARAKTSEKPKNANNGLKMNITAIKKSTSKVEASNNVQDTVKRVPANPEHKNLENVASAMPSKPSMKTYDDKKMDVEIVKEESSKTSKFCQPPTDIDVSSHNSFSSLAKLVKTDIKRDGEKGEKSKISQNNQNSQNVQFSQYRQNVKARPDKNTIHEEASKNMIIKMNFAMETLNLDVPHNEQLSTLEGHRKANEVNKMANKEVLSTAMSTIDHSVIDKTLSTNDHELDTDEEDEAVLEAAVKSEESKMQEIQDCNAILTENSLLNDVQNCLLLS